MTTVLLSLGSNVQPRRYLHAAVAALRERFGALQVSPAYRTAAVGFDGPAFLEVMVDPDAGVYPMVGPGASYAQMITGDFIVSRSAPAAIEVHTSHMF